MKLLDFISYLAGKGLIDAEPLIKYGDDSDLSNREYTKEDDLWLRNVMKIDKYAYLAEHFGLNLGYKRDLGTTHSDELSLDYDKLDIEKIAPGSVPAPPELREDDFLAAVSGRSDEWLQVAINIMTYKEFFGDVTFEVLRNSMPNRKAELIRAVYDDVCRLITPLAQAA